MASRVIISALNRGAYGTNLILADVGRNIKFANHGLDATECCKHNRFTGLCKEATDVANRTLFK